MNGNTVVVVEDEALPLLVAREVLESAGLRVLTFDNAETARDYLLSNQREVGGLFTDVKLLGDMDGLELAKIVAEACPHIAIVVTSGRLTEPPETLPCSARYIEKPWSGIDVLSAIFDAQERD